MELEKIIELLNDKKFKEFRELVSSEKYVDIADIIEQLDEKYTLLAFRSLPKDIASDVFSYLPISTQEDIITSITDKEITSIIEDLYVDDAVDLLDELPAIVVKKILNNAKPETRSVLKYYNKEFLDKFMYLSLTLTLVFYSIWTIEQEIKYLSIIKNLINIFIYQHHLK